MFHFLPARLKGTLAFTLIVVNTVIIFIPIMTIAVFKFILPIKPVQNILSKLLIIIANQWVRMNSCIIKLFHKINWEVNGLDDLKKNEWCLVLSNHQSWVDILVLQLNLLGRVPYIKFFLKKELIWVPLMGLAWWALDFPFMERYSRSFLEKNPHLKGKDVEKTRKACEKFKNSPISIMNFVEGTRFSPEKRKKQNSPFNHLLKPKAGGVAFVLGTMGEYLDCIVDFTIFYPEGVPGFWDFLCGRTTHVIVNVKKIDMTPEILGDYDNDPVFKDNFQVWVNNLWTEKNNELDKLSKAS